MKRINTLVRCSLLLCGVQLSAQTLITDPYVLPFVDGDGDSYSDAAETAFGTDPEDPSSMPGFTPNPVKPNVVIIYLDDLGYSDMSAYGALHSITSPANTPHMDSLADQGMLFTQAHSSSAFCTPSRYAILTAKYPWREFSGIEGAYGGQKNNKELPRIADVTIAEFLKTQGYDTAAMGKWHLGGGYYTTTGSRISNNPTDPAKVDWERRVEFHATDNGFDVFRGQAQAINFAPHMYLKDDRMQIWDPAENSGAGAFRPAMNADVGTGLIKYLEEDFLNRNIVSAGSTDSGCGDASSDPVEVGPRLISDFEQYMADRVATEDTDPFFVYMALNSPHKPHAITAAFNDNSVGYAYGDWMEEVDDRVGRIVAAIDDNGFAASTMVILASDNGPENGATGSSISNGKDSNGPFRGNKRDVWEGGTRGPFVVRWPGQAAPGTMCHDVIWQGDIFATIAAYIGVELADDVAPDGESFLNLVRGQQRPENSRPSIIVSSTLGHLGLKTVDGEWKFIDSTGGGGNNKSWDSSNKTISSPIGVDGGSPKQLFRLSQDLGEDNNLISTLNDDASIRSGLVTQTGVDLLAEIDGYRTTVTTLRYDRIPDNDGDGMSNAYENSHGLNPDSPKDQQTDLDGDGTTNEDEMKAGTAANDSADYFRIIELDDLADDFEVTWPSVADRFYTVYWSTDLEGWINHSTHAGTGGDVTAGLDKTVIDGMDGTIGNLVNLYVRVAVSETAP